MPRKKAAPAEAVDEPKTPKTPKGHTRIYPTHRRDAGDLVVGLPSDGTNSEQLVIGDEGADVPDELAQHLIDSREATAEAPKE